MERDGKMTDTLEKDEMTMDGLKKNGRRID